MLKRTIAFAVLATAFPLLAQGFNCVLLGRHNNYSGAGYNDVWGYAAPNGREYALLGARSGLVVIDVTNPATPIERGFFPWATSTWRDMRTYGTYAYVISEAAGGFQVIDLSNPDSPTLVGFVGTAQFGNCHDICVDTGTGLVYCCGTNTGTPVFDAAANPANPPYVGHLTASGNSNYFHDMCVENGYAYGSMIYNGQLRIYDVANPRTLPYPILSNTTTPSSFTHNAWPNAAGNLVVTTDERAGGVIKLFDITNKSNPIPRGQFTPNSASIPHNAYIVGDLCHVSWYTEGYQCIDISNPNNPVQVAYYDTWPGASGGYNGAWGCYPFLPSGNILISDISTGLYVVRVDLPTVAVAHTPLPDTTDEDGPYTIAAQITSTTSVTGATLLWSTNGTSFTPVAMANTGGDNYSADIPGQYAPTTVSYHFSVADLSGTRRDPATGEYSFFVGNRVFFDDAESDRGWTHGMTATQDDWQRGAPQGRSGTSSGFAWSDPASAYAGSNVWGNDLGGAGFNGSYQNNVNNWLQSPVIPTGGAQGLRLRFARWLSVATGDTGRVLINGNVVWQNPAAHQDLSWQLVDLDISAITNTANNVTLRFELITNGAGTGGGWNLDNIEISGFLDCVPAVHYGTGTPGTGGIPPAVSLNGAPHIGTTFQVTGALMPGGAGTILALGLAPASTPVFGITGLVNPTGAVFLFTVAAGTSGVPLVGTTAWNLSVPNSPALDNLDFFGQVIPFDAGSPGGMFSASDGIRIRICAF